MAMIRPFFPLLIKIQITQAEVDTKREAEAAEGEVVVAVEDLDLVCRGIKAKTVLGIVRVAARTLSKLRRTWPSRISNSRI